jgi:hypothetical protein
VALAIDASSPALVSGTGATITTAAFSPPANSFILVAVGRNGPVSGQDDTGTISGAGLTWTLMGRKSSVGSTGQITGGTAQPGCIEYWWAYSASALTSVTITDTRTNGSGTGYDHAMQPYVITGAETTWSGAITANASSSGLPSVALTTTAANAWVFSANTDWAQKGNCTVGSGQTKTSEYNNTGQISIHFWRQTSATATSGTSVTSNLTAPSAQQFDQLAVEIRPANGGSSFSGSASLSGSGTLTLAGTPAETGSAALSGSGTLTPSGAASVAGSASLSGSGTLSPAGAPAIPGSAAFSGSGTLTLAGSPAPAGAVTLSGSGTLTASGTAGGGSSDFSGLVMLTGSGSLVVDQGVPSFTGAVSFTGTGTLTVSARSEMYLFAPPTEDRVMDPTGKDFLWSRVKFQQGLAVTKFRNGTYKLEQVHDPDMADIDVVYLGGHEYVVTDAEALNLIAAGYAANLTVVT